MCFFAMKIVFIAGQMLLPYAAIVQPERALRPGGNIWSSLLKANERKTVSHKVE
jgi:hypothetical protein